MNIMYLTFGDNLKNHYQANFSILTFLKEKSKIDSITVFTDSPDFYKSLGDQINVIEIDEKRLKEWEGGSHFFWRVKIKAIQYLINKLNDAPVMYLDSDTFLYHKMDIVFSKLDSGRAIMHENEGRLNAIKFKTEKKMWSQIKHGVYGGVKITEKHCMWNAGAVVVPKENNKETIALALQICDDMCEAGVTKRLIEQFALSVALEEMYGLVKITETIGHYWGNKNDWNQLIVQFYLKNNLSDIQTKDYLLALEEINLLETPTRKTIPNTRRRLINRIVKLFPDKNLMFADTQ